MHLLLSMVWQGRICKVLPYARESLMWPFLWLAYRTLDQPQLAVSLQAVRSLGRDTVDFDRSQPPANFQIRMCWMSPVVELFKPSQGGRSAHIGEVSGIWYGILPLQISSTRNALHIWTISSSPNSLLVSDSGPCIIMVLITLLNSAPAYSSSRMALTICRYFKVAILVLWSLPDLAERHTYVWNACFPSPFHHKVANLILHNTVW